MNTKKIHQSRRFFLKGLACSASIPLLNLSSNNVWGSSLVPSGILHLDLIKMLRFPDSAKVIGRKYLQTCSDTADVKVLARLIYQEGTPVSNDRQYHQLSELNEFVQARIRKDFEDERVVLVEGWVLSQTEARLYALASLV